MPRVIILGGGISGLSTAHYLLRDYPDLDVLLVEGEKNKDEDYNGTPQYILILVHQTCIDVFILSRL